MSSRPLPMQAYINHLQDRALDHAIEKHLAMEVRHDEDEVYDHEIAIQIIDRAINAEIREAASNDR